MFLTLVTTPSHRDGGPPGPANPSDPGKLGMFLLLLMLSVLFLASLVLFAIFRVKAAQWPPPGTPRLPGGLWVSTVVLVVSSGTMHAALRSARRNRQGGLRLAMVVTTLLGLAFLALQAYNWHELVVAGLPMQKNFYAFFFYTLTGLHAAHVIGGVVALLLVTVFAFLGRYGPTAHAGIWRCAVYWHFLDVVWLILFATIEASG